MKKSMKRTKKANSQSTMSRTKKSRSTTKRAKSTSFLSKLKKMFS